MGKSCLPSVTLKYFFSCLLLFSFWFLSTNYSEAGRNKEAFSLHKNNFSEKETIDFEGVYQTLGYEFDNQENLVNALYPLLAPLEQQDHLKYPQLEFLGDSVLALIMRERVISLYPDLAKGVQVQLYDSLVCNRALTQLYCSKLPIEQYMPYPGARKCYYCDVVESLIGAIYQDAGYAGLEKCREFIGWLMDDEFINEKMVSIINPGQKRKKRNKRMLSASNLQSTDAKRICIRE